MANVCEQNARKLGIKHTTSRIPWGKQPFPRLPAANEAIENVARLARYHTLLQGMKQAGAKVIAFGHHADDQVETALMRMAKGSSDYGQAGMKSCRRWGMGSSTDKAGLGWAGLGWAGLDGMNKWIIRPLLKFPKDRILATCSEHNLEYVLDKTNFQPSLTLRNAIRYQLSGQPLPKNLPTDIQDSMRKITGSITPSIHDRVKGLRAKADVIDNEVDAFIAHHRLPSPPGTALFTLHAIQRISEPETRLAVMYRILRAVSPHPWGSLEAEAKHRTRKTDPLLRSLWQPSRDASMLRFSGPASVLWSPTILSDDNELSKGSWIGWIASRQPPIRTRASALTIELSDAVSQAVRENRSLTILYDCRFNLHFDLQKAPSHVLDTITRGGGRIFIEPSRRWVYPVVKMQAQNSPDVSLLQWISDTPTLRHESIQADQTTSSGAWISIDWVRPFNSL